MLGLQGEATLNSARVTCTRCATSQRDTPAELLLCPRDEAGDSSSPGKWHTAFPSGEYEKQCSANYLPMKAMASGKNCERFWLQ